MTRVNALRTELMMKWMNGGLPTVWWKKVNWKSGIKIWGFIARFILIQHVVKFVLLNLCVATPTLEVGVCYGMAWHGHWHAGRSFQYSINGICVATICEQIKSDWLDKMGWIYTIACLFFGIYKSITIIRQWRPHTQQKIYDYLHLPVVWIGIFCSFLSAVNWLLHWHSNEVFKRSHLYIGHAQNS